MKKLISVFLLLSTTTAFAQARHNSRIPGEKKIEDCAYTSNEAVCVGKIINKKLNRIMKKLNVLDDDLSSPQPTPRPVPTPRPTPGRGRDIFSPFTLELTDDAGTSCKGTLGKKTIVINSQSACRNVVSGMSIGNIQNVDGIKINGKCTSIENSQNYTTQELIDTCQAIVDRHLFSRPRR